MKIVISVVVAVVIMFSVPVMLFVSNFNRAVSLETQIVAQYDDLRNTMSNYTLRVQEMLQVTDMYREDLESIITATFQGRYGPDGSQAMFQWIQENNLTLDVSMYRSLQVTMEAGRTEFQNKQTRMIDTKRVYQRELNSLISGFFMRMAGKPSIDLEKYDIIVSSEAQQRFDSGVDEAIQLRR